MKRYKQILAVRYYRGIVSTSGAGTCFLDVKTIHVAFITARVVAV